MGRNCPATEIAACQEGSESLADLFLESCLAVEVTETRLHRDCPRELHSDIQANVFLCPDRGRSAKRCSSGHSATPHPFG